MCEPTPFKRCKGEGERRAFVSEKGRKTGIRSVISFISIMCVFMASFEPTSDLDVVDFSSCLSVAKLSPRATPPKVLGRARACRDSGDWRGTFA
ncbi:hypothetical protein NPIL_300521 [Nephila pilipes]|uniref:Uncharacterized protein n=1 Tax=Nephila pilipes TaxID=299642 RepID=A0A8X6ULW0_NEPPI|nr:hypothetical protein NPIL_300521 [Nephila pilipes]